MGQLFYVRELAPNGPAMNCGEIQPGDRVLEVRIEYLNVYIDLSCYFVGGIVYKTYGVYEALYHSTVLDD